MVMRARACSPHSRTCPLAYVVFSSDDEGWGVGAFRYGNLGKPGPVIPEPGTMLLMGIGGLAIGLGRRFGRK
jgi:hypothetical protein